MSLLVDAAQPAASDTVLDVSCGPGSIVAAFAQRVSHAIGLDTTEAMLAEARKLAAAEGLQNVDWYLGDAYALPFPNAHFDITSCRFAFHHLQNPAGALQEMLRVTRPGGKIIVCDGIASEDPKKAQAFNAMERHRDPSTAEFLSLSAFASLFKITGLSSPQITRFQLPTERDALAEESFPANDNRELLRRMIDQSVDGDTMGVGAYRDGPTVRFAYPSVVLVANRA
ncbi:MAG: class I SAM-dependent methyltransferase [Alphaproteobacteria bacterium]